MWFVCIEGDCVAFGATLAVALQKAAKHVAAHAHLIKDTDSVQITFRSISAMEV